MFPITHNKPITLYLWILSQCKFDLICKSQVTRHPSLSSSSDVPLIAMQLSVVFSLPAASNLTPVISSTPCHLQIPLHNLCTVASRTCRPSSDSLHGLEHWTIFFAPTLQAYSLCLASLTVKEEDLSLLTWIRPIKLESSKNKSWVCQGANI